MRQNEYLLNYCENNRPKFNKDLLVRSDDDLINSLKNVIMSIERDDPKTFTIKVIGFDVISSYREVNRLLFEYEESINKKKKKTTADDKKHSKDNAYAYVDLKGSDLKIIKVDYFIQIFEKKNMCVNNDTITVYIAIPRLIDNFCYRINGNLYSAVYQIVDASTYNNTEAKSTKKQNVTMKTMFSPIRVYRYYGKLVDIDANSIPCTYFIINVFSKSILLMKYMLAHFGFEKTLDFLRLKGVSIVKNIWGVNKDKSYIFPLKNGLYVVVSKFMYNATQITQSFIYTLIISLNSFNDIMVDDIYNNISVWESALGADFLTSKGSYDILPDKGRSLLSSLECIYDIDTRNDLHLSDYDKEDIYCLLRWMMYEYQSLRSKQNTDISTKRIRWAGYIAALYAVRLFKGIIRIADKGDKAELSTIKKALQINPMHLINSIKSSDLINYKDTVNDLDVITALKYTYKGPSGISESNSSINSTYRSIHPSHLGRVDVDSSSSSDPGVSGTICPLKTIYNWHFDQYQEPSTWASEMAKIISEYNSLNSKIEVVKLLDDIGVDVTNDLKVEKQSASLAKSVMQNLSYCIDMMNIQETEPEMGTIDIFGNGLFFI